ncbi:MAG: hypothetical protein A2157_02500 [Deltaproteobacteria bacterium RBG_16_47_11]|nr:MAG: hypothetical protein A2157_02500 [Deltaproteobacteria bacterium RBG_16_47_11]
MDCKKFKVFKHTKEKEIPGKDPELNEKEHLYDLLIHDLTGPLSIAATSTANLLHKSDRYGPLTERQERLVERILRNVHKAQTLLQEMIEISRSEEGIFKKEFFSVEKALRESLIDVLETNAPHAAEKLYHIEDSKELESLLKPHGISIEITGKYCRSSFCHDQKKVRQIFRNLMSNAMKYRREWMRVSIRGELDLLISVKDDGMGIPPGDQEAVFKRFVRLSDKRRSDVPGFGLGLTGVKALVEAMKGEITLVSQEGAGTQFTVRIPPLQP